ncbi:MAG: CRISPR-associated protein Cas4 [Acidobacteriota bacterium]|nr:CRISPR-associated protein Cas4 [Blastocatellia bacterium]MDW8413023.1 CRISPR-associated protein Cas4 [Acidobacteriota bacterium]
MEEILLISSLNEFAFCERRFALMSIEGLWEDNEHTIQGSILHESTELSGYTTTKGVKLIRALPLYSSTYGLLGKADTVEYDGKFYIPIEYKKGKKRQFENDDIQLCAQALCLEEMFSTAVPYGFIYHAESNKRRKVFIDQALRQLTIETIAKARKLLQSNITPPAQLKPRCRGCSLYDTCLPKLTDPQSRQHLLNKYYFTLGGGHGN